MESRCFICGVRVGRGNQPSIGIHERMSKLVSVSHTVEHSSTIISDILSRILNETVMREETICRICFNLLNDIDYHLKEAQEKTDEITNKFLDKGKDPLNYKPALVVTAGEESGKKASRRGNHRRSNRQELPSESAPPPPAPLPPPAEMAADDPLTEDEMSVNTLNKNKQKLLSHVLNPSKKVRMRPEKSPPSTSVAPALEGHEEARTALSSEESDSEAQPEPKSGKKRKGKENRSGQDPPVKKSKKSRGDESKAELSTVNLDELGDILSTPKTTFFAKKSDPALKGDRPSKRSCKRLSSPEEDEQPLPSNLTKPGLISSIDSPNPVTCNVCFKVFKKGSNLQLHMEKVHLTNPALVTVDERQIPETHKCHLCPREFTNEKSLAAHKSDHSAESLEARSITVNVKVVKPATEAEVKATCPQCHKTFRRHFNMRIHVDRVHNKLKNFQCSKCDKSFATNSDLKQHMNVHGGGKLFTCEECDRSFTNRDSFIFHKKQHTNTRTHFCVICKKGFFKASCLNRHMRSHTGERPYKCDHCCKGFSQSTSLRVHMGKCGQGRSPVAAD